MSFCRAIPKPRGICGVPFLTVAYATGHYNAPAEIPEFRPPSACSTQSNCGSRPEKSESATKWTSELHFIFLRRLKQSVPVPVGSITGKSEWPETAIHYSSMTAFRLLYVVWFIINYSTPLQNYNIFLLRNEYLSLKTASPQGSDLLNFSLPQSLKLYRGEPMRQASSVI